MRLRASLVVTVAGSAALASCVLDFDEVGPRGQGGTGATGGSSGGITSGGESAGGTGGDASGAGGTGGALQPPVTHDCTNQQEQCVVAPGELFVLSDTCANPKFTGGRGHDANAIELGLVACGCECDGPCTVSVNRHVFGKCETELLGDFTLVDGQCTDTVAAFNPNHYHTVGAPTFVCESSSQPNVGLAFVQPVAACPFESVGCPGDTVCLSTSAPVCLEKPMGLPCPDGFTKSVEVLKETTVLANACECDCEAGEEDSCPDTIFAGATCAATTELGWCGKAPALNYSGQGDCEPIETKSNAGLISTKLCCNKSP